MKKTALALTLLALAASFSAKAEWKVIATPDMTGGKYTQYVDNESIRIEGRRVRFWLLYDLATPKSLPSGAEFRSVRERIELDCEEETAAATTTHFSVGAMGTGDPLKSLGAQPAVPIVPSTMLAVIAKRTCAAR